MLKNARGDTVELWLVGVLVKQQLPIDLQKWGGVDSPSQNGRPFRMRFQLTISLVKPSIHRVNGIGV